MPEGNHQGERELTRFEIEQLIAAGLIKPDRRASLLARFRESIEWKAWAGIWTAALGAVFLMAGVIFFFAWNWKDLSPLTRFAVLEGGVTVATVAALVAGIGNHLGQWLLLAASVLTGVLLAVYGQVYQTGADAFEVFAFWAGAIVAWVIVSRFSPLWILWLAVLQTAIATYAGQVLIPEGTSHWTTAYLILGLVSVIAVVVREWLETRDRFSWLRGEWMRIALVAVSLFWLSAIPWEMIFEYRPWDSADPPLSRWIGLIFWLAAVSGGTWVFTKQRPSLTSMGLCVLSGAVILTLWLGKEILDGSDSAGFWMLAAILALGIFTGAAVIIAKAARLISGEDKSSEEREVVS